MKGGRPEYASQLALSVLCSRSWLCIPDPSASTPQLIRLSVYTTRPDQKKMYTESSFENDFIESL